MITLNAIAKRLEEFGTNHFFIKSYSFGSPDDVDLDKFQDFPLMHVVYTGSDYEERTKTFSFEVYVFDRPNREEQMTVNQREVVSDAQQCLEDVIADIANGGNIFLFDEDYEVTTAGITPLIDERSNLLTGALLDLTIQVPYQRDACNLPIDGVQSAGGEISYRRRGILRIRTQDGTTDVQSVNEIRVTNGTLTDEGDGVVSIDTGGVDILGDLENVNLDDPHDREALVYDEETQSWINDGIGKVVIPIFNTTYEDILPGRPLQAAGSQGDRIAVEPWDGSKSGLQYVGNAETLIPARSNGHALVYGEIRGLNTSQWPVGQLLQLSGINPSFAPFGMRYYADGFSDQPFVSAMVTRSHANTGRIFVRMWSPGYRPRLESLDDVEADNPYLGATLYWTGQDWRYRPQTSKFIVDFAQDLTEIYYYATPLDAQEYRSPRSDTPSEGNKIVRKIWYTPTAQANIDTAEWTLLETLEDNALYSDVITAFTAALNTSPGGDTPISIKTTWEEVPAFTGLLETYSGAAAAYSLRLLDSTYTGDAIRVRRASDNAEQDIGFDASGELDTSALATFCAGTDGFVKTWYDQSGNGNDATQGTTANQPKVYDSVTGVVLENSKPSIEGDGTDGKHLNVPTLTLSANLCVIGVVSFDTFGLDSMPIGAVDPLKSYWFRGNATNLTITNVSQNGFENFTVTYAAQNLIFMNRAGTNVLLSFNGVAETKTERTTQGLNFAINRVGGAFNNAYSFDGRYQEFIAYNSDQSANRAAIEANINNAFSIYGQSPTGFLADYPGAAAAYSLRQLISTATYAVAVRRDSDDAVLPIGFVDGELDTDTLAAFCSGANGFVAVWYDQSGEGNHATQATAASQPKIYDASTGVTLEGGQPIVEGGAAKWLVLPLSTTGSYKVYEAGKVVPVFFSVLFGGTNGSDYVLIAQDGNSSTTLNANSTINALRKDGATFAPTTRNDVYDALALRHLVYVDVDLAYLGTEVRTNYSSPGGTGMYNLHELIVYPDTSTHTPSAIESNINDFYTIY